MKLVNKCSFGPHARFNISDSPGWRIRHPLGPVHFDFTCNLCGEVALRDNNECDNELIILMLERIHSCRQIRDSNQIGDIPA